MADPTFPAARGGTDKHRAVAYLLITVGSETRKFYAYTRATYTGSVDIRENTNAGAPVAQSQMMREETPSFDLEVNIPWDEAQARDSVNFLRAGRVIAEFDLRNEDGQGLFYDGYLEQYGSYIIERSTIEISRDDFTTVRATVRALGYSRANNIGPQTMPT